SQTAGDCLHPRRMEREATIGEVLKLAFACRIGARNNQADARSSAQSSAARWFDGRRQMEHIRPLGRRWARGTSPPDRCYSAGRALMAGVALSLRGVRAIFLLCAQTFIG